MVWDSWATLHTQILRPRNLWHISTLHIWLRSPVPDLPSLEKWSGTMPLLGKWPALPWELVRDHAPPGEVLRERVTSQVRASLSGWGHTSRGGSYLRFPREGQNAPPGAVILYTPCLNHHQQWQNCIKENEGLHLYSLYVVMVFRKHTQILSGTYLHVSMLFINK